MVKGTIREAVAEIIKLNGKDIFKDSKHLSSQSSSNPFKSAKIGDYVKFGSYPQTSSGQNQPIEWQVLSIENNKMLVISKYGLDCKIFDSSLNNWGNSKIRKWLNGEFYNKAFTDQEKKSIKSSNLSDVGTTDNVFFLSKEEAKKYFANDEGRRCKATEYAKSNGAYVNSDNGYSFWWLRSPYPSSSDFVYCVSLYGFIDFHSVNFDDCVVRPALWINL